MSYSTKNKVLIGLLLLLLVANVITIGIFWLGKPAHPALIREQPSTYLVRELGFDEKQKTTFLALVKQHQEQAEALRQQIKTARDNFFKLLQQPTQTDSEKITGAKSISLITAQLDLITFDHFKQVRALCTTEQQKKFDNIIADVMHMAGGPGQAQGPGAGNRSRPSGPPPGEREGPPPPGRPGGEEGPPPPPR